MADIAARIAEVRERIAEAARAANRNPDDITLIGAAKHIPTEVVQVVVEDGLKDIGHNRAQELLVQANEISNVRWHFIGVLQRNKVPKLASVVALWHTVERIELGRAIAKHQPGASVLVEVNIAGEQQKAGSPVSETPRLVDELRTLGLDVRGLMCVPPAGENPQIYFAGLRELGESLDLPELSMGMSNDFELAICEGATMVRIGSAIFGQRFVGDNGHAIR